LKRWKRPKQKLRDNLEVYSSTLKDFATDIGYYDYLKDDEDPDEDRIGNVNALFDDIAHYVSSHPESTFAEYLQNVSLLTNQDDMDGGNYVSLMTIHVAKGLEFDNVFVISMNEGSFPSMRAENEGGRDALEEERRLAYVAMTRAKKRLFCSCNTAYSYQTDSHSIPSRFFKEAGLSLPKNTSFSLRANPGANNPSKAIRRRRAMAIGATTSPMAMPFRLLRAKNPSPSPRKWRIMVLPTGRWAISLSTRNSVRAWLRKSSMLTSLSSTLTRRGGRRYCPPTRCSNA
jgi:hypothetical protein